MDIHETSTLIDISKTLAPGEARTLDLRISLSVLTYKYDALTDCATGAYHMWEDLLILFAKIVCKKMNIQKETIARSLNDF